MKKSAPGFSLVLLLKKSDILDSLLTILYSSFLLIILLIFKDLQILPKILILSILYTLLE